MYNNYSYSSSSSSVGELDTSMFAGLMIAYIIVVLVLAVFMIVCMWKIFKKAGRGGWEAIIPIYNAYVLYDIIFGNGIYMLICFIPVVGSIFALISMVYLAKAYGCGGGFACGLIFLSIIFLPILAFGKSEYVGPQRLFS